MTITVSGEKKSFQNPISIKELIEIENVENPLYVTVTLNDEFLKSEDFETTILSDGDAVEFLYFMGGGR